MDRLAPTPVAFVVFWLVFQGPSHDFSSAAIASTVFDFRGAEANVEGVALPSMAGPPVTVTARGFLANGSPNADVFQTPFGLGVQNPNAPPAMAGPQARNDTGATLFDTTTMTRVNTFHLDGRNGGEFIRLEFSVPVKLVEACFALVHTFDEQYGIAVAGQAPVFFSINPSGDVEFPDTLPFATAFDLYAPAWNRAAMSFSEWNLQKLEVEVIPEASSFVIWSLFLLGACSVAYVRAYLRRRNLLAPAAD